MLDRKDIDAVVIATPDHWHAIQMIAACQAGKDVYVEKPLSITIVEGRAMVDAARKHDRIVQVGTHRRSSRMYAQLAEVGALRGARQGHGGAGRVLPATWPPAGSATPPTRAPPAGLDWDLWLGPRPARPFQSTIMPYKFRWWHLYSSQMANWGVHYFDLIRWLTGELAPASRLGARRPVRRGRRPHHPRHHRGDLRARLGDAHGLQHLRGQRPAGAGPRRRGRAPRHARDRLRQRSRASRSSPSAAAQFQDPKPRRKAEVVKATDGDLDQQAARDFLDCVKGRKRPDADVEEGHRSTTFAHLANIALATRKRLDWDPQAERFTNCDEANQLLHYEYRKPWTLGS